jgi:predicted amino acid-binding ACT domain protein
MNGFMISTQDAPGIAARLLEATAARGVNVFPAYGLADGRTGIVLVGSDDEDGLRAAIADAALQATALEMITTEIDNRPGTGAALFRKLADAGVNLRAAVPIGMGGDKVQIALAAEDASALKAALG